MRSAHLRRPYVLQKPPDVSIGGAGGDPEVNKFEQVSTDGYQMSLAGGTLSNVSWVIGT